MSLLFKPEHIEAIRQGEKTVTRRDWAEKYGRPTVGSVQIATDEMFTSDADADCYVRILDTYRESLGEMEESDARKEGGYSMAEFRAAWERINGEAFDPAQVVDVVEFEYVGRERPEQVKA